MGCPNTSFDEEHRAAATAPVDDVFLFNIMRIVNLPVDVHLKDGSVYSGTFYTASFHSDFAIVLKRARMSKKGSCNANVENTDVIETLVIMSEELVQVVAKSVRSPAKGFPGNVTGDDMRTVAGTFSTSDLPEREAKGSNSSADQQNLVRTRHPSRTENGFAHGYKNDVEVENRNSGGIGLSKKEEILDLGANGRQIGDGGSQLEPHHDREMTELEKQQMGHEVRGSSLGLDARDTQSTAVDDAHMKAASSVSSVGTCNPSAELDNGCVEARTSANDLSFNDVASSEVSTATASVAAATSRPHPSSSSPTAMVPPKSFNPKRTAKESKLNPGARMFSPSFAHQRSATPPAVSPVPSMTFIPNNYPAVPIATALPEVEVNAYVPRPSLPAKFVPYGNLLAGNGDTDVQYSPPMVGHMTSRTQPTIRHGGHYHPVQVGPTYVHPNSQNVMAGRTGQLLYVHPVSQGLNGYSQVSPRPLLTPHQVHIPKHQGTAVAQALQLSTNPPFIATGQPPYIVSNHIPISQPPYPVIRPILVPGSNGFLGSKFS